MTGISRFATLLILVLSGCSSLPSGAERTAAADTLAAVRSWQMTQIATREFTLASWQQARVTSADELSIYIEGDGLAWVSSTQPSGDPTPITPLALLLAVKQPDGNAAYLARPCQFVKDKRCHERYWTSHRFAPEVVLTMNEAIDTLKQRFGAQRLTLIGYSGGANIAALLAARRKDVNRLVTIAGNLDHRAWTEYHRITPLSGSLNAAADMAALRTIPQWHFAGSRDKIIPATLVQNFVRDQPAAHVSVVDGYDHQCCWVEAWPRLWRETQQ